jgi:hypothetical protein
VWADEKESQPTNAQNERGVDDEEIDENDLEGNNDTNLFETIREETLPAVGKIKTSFEFKVVEKISSAHCTPLKALKVLLLIF